MRQCWEYKPEERPHFLTLEVNLKALKAKR